VMPCWLNNPRAICEYTRNMGFVKPSPKIILRVAVGIGGILENRNKTATFLKKARLIFTSHSILAKGSYPVEPRNLPVLSVSVPIERPERRLLKCFGFSPARILADKGLCDFDRTDQSDELAVAGDADCFAAFGAPDQFRKLLSCFVQTDHSHMSSFKFR
jgi:hypothetical protein